MKYELLKRSHIKRNIIIGIVVVLVLSAVVLTFTRAKYRTTQSIPLIQGTINFSPSDFNVLALYLNKGTETISADKAPHVGYTLNTEQSTCEVNDKDAGGEIVYENGNLSFMNMNYKGTKRSVYFDLIPDDQVPTVSIATSTTDTSITVIADATDNIGIYYYYFQLDDGEEIRSEEASYTFDDLVKDSIHTVTIRVEDAAGNEASDSAEVTVGIKAGDVILASENAPTGQTTDWTNEGQGVTYYYTGNPNNWVQFGGFYWRIIRINGDGSIRIIYQGTSTNTTGEGTQIGTSAFNSSYNNNMYVGYMYTSGQVHGLGTSSTIKEVLDTWYNTYIENEQSNIHYGQYIDGNAGFCGNRTPSTNNWFSNGSGGTGTSTTYYGAYIRLVTGSSPSLQCSDSTDIYTTSGSSTGNGTLLYPIGLISADEVALTGITWDNANTGSYLYTGQSYWTMSPNRFYNDVAYVFRVHSSGILGSTGDLGSWSVFFMNGVRPVINLRSDVSLTGSGTVSDPFKVVGAS